MSISMLFPITQVLGTDCIIFLLVNIFPHYCHETTLLTSDIPYLIVTPNFFLYNEPHLITP